ncbi:MAG: hypothetical protein PVF05_11405 [Gemmatimonadales bacterium]
MSDTRRGVRLVLTALAVLAAGTGWTVPAFGQDAGQAPSELEGRVVRGGGMAGDTARREGLADLTVELHRVTAGGGEVVDSTVSGPDGAFRFRLADDEEARPLYLAAVRYEGIRYFGPALHPGMTNEGPYEIPVYDTSMVSATPSDLHVGVRHVVVTPGIDGGLDVAEVIDVSGPEDRTLVAVSDTLSLWSTALPDGAEDPQVIEGGAPADVVRFVGNRVELGSTLTPLGVRLSYTYRLDGDELELAVEHPTNRVEVVVAGAEAEVSGASHAETTTRSGRLVHRYEGTALEPGDTIGIKLLAQGGGVDRWALVWAVLGLALLAAAGALAWTGRTTG